MKLILKHWKSSAAVIGGVVLLTFFVVFFFSTPKPKSDKPADIAAFVASNQFKNLPDAKQEEYLQKMRGNREDRRKVTQAMTEQQRKTMMDNMRAVHEKKMIEEMRSYFKMSKEDKNKFLDAKIAEQDKRMEEFAKRRAAQTAQGGNNNQNNRQRGQQGGQAQNPNRQAQRTAMMKNRIETTSPEVRAARQKMFQDMMKRRQETGKMPQRPGGR